MHYEQPSSNVDVVIDFSVGDVVDYSLVHPFQLVVAKVKRFVY